jgi:hypothetical protein
VGDERTLVVVLVALALGKLSGLSRALLEDLLNDVVIDRSAKFVLKSGLGSCVECSLDSLAVCAEDLERGDEVSQRNALVGLPLLVGLDIVNEDDKVIAALEVDLGLLSLAASHCEGLCGRELCW